MLRSLLSATCLCIASQALAADLGAPAPVTPASPVSYISEIRLGGLNHALAGREKSGGLDINAEVLSIKPFRYADPIWDALVPRFHVGGNYSTGGRTSYGYAGLTWTFDITPSFFVEGSFGAAFHDGNTSRIRVPGEARLGCIPLFRESASVGYRLSANWSVMVTIDHVSNGGLCKANDGLTNIGARIGYTF